ncbi:MAG: PLP-dependent cysteine synthase family protein [Chromatiaceae bacterium]
MDSATRSWVHEAISRIEADFQRSADTHLVALNLPASERVRLYLKDESTHPTGSLKHRLARSLFLYGLCNGWIHRDTVIVEASSGSTAVSEAYFARLLGLRFIAVMPKGTSQTKIDQIAFYGGESHLVTGGDIYAESKRLASELKGHYMDQFTYAERATDWHGNNNIAESIFDQMAREPNPVPDWIVVTAGTGGTSATIGRYIHYKCFDTRLCVADPENSVFYDAYQDGDRTLTIDGMSRIEGIGRPKVEPSFIPSVIDRMIRVPDAASIAAIQLLERLLNRRCGGSTGTNLYAAFQIMSELNTRGRVGSLVTLLCDSGERYLDTYYNADWIASQGLDPTPYAKQLDAFCETGVMPSP